MGLGVTPQMLRGKRFVRVHEGVWRHRDHAMTAPDRLEAARLALPDDARVTGITRLRLLGLDVGPRLPLRFVVARDHVDLEDVFLHRPVRMPPLDHVGVMPLAAYVAFCARARVIDAIEVGDWLLRHGHVGWDELRDFCVDQRWRDGAPGALWVLGWLDGDSWSLRESEVRGSSSSPACRPRRRTSVRSRLTTRPASATWSTGGGVWSSSTRASTISSTVPSTSRTSTGTPPCGATPCRTSR
jgi:hypothetical protein